LLQGQCHRSGIADLLLAIETLRNTVADMGGVAFFWPTRLRDRISHLSGIDFR
jgi:hypothetical protein